MPFFLATLHASSLTLNVAVYAHTDLEKTYPLLTVFELNEL